MAFFNSKKLIDPKDMENYLGNENYICQEIYGGYPATIDITGKNIIIEIDGEIPREKDVASNLKRICRNYYNQLVNSENSDTSLKA